MLMKFMKEQYRKEKVKTIFYFPFLFQPPRRVSDLNRETFSEIFHKHARNHKMKVMSPLSMQTNDV